MLHDFQYFVSFLVHFTERVNSFNLTIGSESRMNSIWMGCKAVTLSQVLVELSSLATFMFLTGV
jgi:hypothetical protein